MKITRRQLRKIIRESLLTEAEMLKIMHNPYEDLDTMNAIANYALTNDIQGALADPLIDIDNVYYDIDEMKGWVHKVGKDDEGYFSEDVVVPENWDLEAVYQFMDDLEDAAFKARQKRDRAATAGDADGAWIEFLGDEFISELAPDDLKSLGWKQYKRYIRLSPPHSISHAVDEIHVTPDRVSSAGPGTYEEFVDFLERRAGRTLKKRKIYRSPPPLYD